MGKNEPLKMKTQRTQRTNKWTRTGRAIQSNKKCTKGDEASKVEVGRKSLSRYRDMNNKKKAYHLVKNITKDIKQKSPKIHEKAKKKKKKKKENVCLKNNNIGMKMPQSRSIAFPGTKRKERQIMTKQARTKNKPFSIDELSTVRSFIITTLTEIRQS